MVGLTSGKPHVPDVDWNTSLDDRECSHGSVTCALSGSQRESSEAAFDDRLRGVEFFSVVLFTVSFCYVYVYLQQKVDIFEFFSSFLVILLVVRLAIPTFSR